MFSSLLGSSVGLIMCFLHLSVSRLLSCLFLTWLRFCVPFGGLSRCRTFHGSFEEDFAASTRHDTVMAPRCFVSTDQTHFGCGGRLSQRWAEMRHKRTSLNQRTVSKSLQQTRAHSLCSDCPLHCETFLAFTRHKSSGDTVWAVVKMSAKAAKRRFCSRLIYSYQKRQWWNQGGDRNKQGDGAGCQIKEA